MALDLATMVGSGLEGLTSTISVASPDLGHRRIADSSWVRMPSGAMASCEKFVRLSAVGSQGPCTCCSAAAAIRICFLIARVASVCRDGSCHQSIDGLGRMVGLHQLAAWHRWICVAHGA